MSATWIWRVWIKIKLYISSPVLHSVFPCSLMCRCVIIYKLLTRLCGRGCFLQCRGWLWRVPHFNTGRLAVKIQAKILRISQKNSWITRLTDITVKKIRKLCPGHVHHFRAKNCNVFGLPSTLVWSAATVHVFHQLRLESWERAKMSIFQLLLDCRISYKAALPTFPSRLLNPSGKSHHVLSTKMSAPQSIFGSGNGHGTSSSSTRGSDESVVFNLYSGAVHGLSMQTSLYKKRCTIIF